MGATGPGTCRQYCGLTHRPRQIQLQPRGPTHSTPSDLDTSATSDDGQTSKGRPTISTLSSLPSGSNRSSQDATASSTWYRPPRRAAGADPTNHALDAIDGSDTKPTPELQRPEARRPRRGIEVRRADGLAVGCPARREVPERGLGTTFLLGLLRELDPVCHRIPVQTRHFVCLALSFFPLEFTFWRS